jgi:dCTP diphosphatase
VVTVTSAERSLKALQEDLTEFRDARGWAPLHTPENLAKAVSVEAGELLELFLWRTDTDTSDDFRSALASEMADVLAYLLHLADVTDIDLAKALLAKIKQNSLRFPLTP